MEMKKVVNLLLIAMLLTVCTMAGAETYSATKSGFGGDVTVTVEVIDGKIVACEAQGDAETPGVGAVAIDTLPGRIVEAQSADVDAIAGATVTSTALLQAARDALDAAGFAAAEGASGQDKSAEAAIEKTVDFVVVGGGGSGLAGALSALDQGMTVLVIEKQDTLGGNAAISGGDVWIYGSTFEKSLGIDQDYDLAYQDLRMAGRYYDRAVVSKTLIDNNGAAIDWLWELLDYEPMPDLTQSCDLGTSDTVHGYMPTPEVGSVWTVAMEEKIRTYDTAEIMTRVEGYELIVEGDTVTGVRARSNLDGQEYILRANKGVLLATGAFPGANSEAAAAYGIHSVYRGGVASDTGDGVLMAMDIGAGAYKLDLLCERDAMSYELTPGIGVSIGSMYKMLEGGSVICVEGNGYRYASEYDGDWYPAINPRLVKVLKDEKYYLVMDQDTYTNVFTADGKYDYETWAAGNSCAPGAIAHGETIEEAAKHAGIDPLNLSATVQFYNALAKNGYADEYRRLGAKPLGDGPYYIVRMNIRYNTSSGGLLVNENCQVLREDETVILGLYASGNSAGGAFGDIYYKGSSLAWCFTSGMLAGQNAATR